MRLWSIHPSYLDAKGLVALWRESLLAQKVLREETKGYKNHPQLERFKEQINPEASIAFYLMKVWEESRARGYSFDENKIMFSNFKLKSIKVTKGQLDFEMKHLCQKLKQRDPQKFKLISPIKTIKPHPLFEPINGGIAQWEKKGDLHV